MNKLKRTSKNRKVIRLSEEIIRHQLDKQSIIKLTQVQLDEYLVDFRQYCEEMAFTSKEEISRGAVEYIACQIHYGLIR
jgi:hypothetical protein